MAGAHSEAETLDRLAGDWRIYQLKKGHRFSTDDLMTAWTAAAAAPRASKLLDLGAGIGSVGLLTLWRLAHEAHLTMVEVQRLSHDLALKTVAHNALQARVVAHNADLRETTGVLPAGARYDLVTGSPPYIPADRGVQSPHPQKAAARIELHGSVFDYCAAAARVMSDDGRFCFVHAAADERPEAAVQAAGMTLIARRDVVFRADQPPLISLFTCAWGGDRQDHPVFTIRGQDGRWTDEYLEMRRTMGTVVWRPGEEP